MVYSILINLILFIRGFFRHELPRLVPFDIKIANTSIWLSAIAYCSTETYSQHKFRGAAEGFVYYGQFADKVTDMQGYYGYHAKFKKIFVVYRGTDSYLNTWDDLMTYPVDAQYPNCTRCKIHHGMKICYENTIMQVHSAVYNLTKLFPGYELVLSGHSLGAAVATLSGIDLIQRGYNVSLYTFGSPRIGNKDFSDYAGALFANLSDSFNSYRFTHNRDIIPHVPYSSMGYVHITNEVYEDKAHVLTSCYGPEDKACSQQWGFVQCNIQDHLLYLNLVMDCSSV